jgi:pimeloyl-ACP methyl ester carboxylesterase
LAAAAALPRTEMRVRKSGRTRDEGESNESDPHSINRSGLCTCDAPAPALPKTGELPAGLKTLRVNGYDMAYMESGSGRPLVMVHGAMSDYRTWAAQMEPLGRTNRAIAVSLRHYFPERWDGNGGSFSWQQHVADMSAFIAVINAGPVDLIGHSRGGLIAFELARAQPGLVRSLVVLAQNLKNERNDIGRCEGKRQPKRLDAHSDGADRQLLGKQ